MSFVVDYKSLNAMQKGINNNYNAWNEGLNALSKRIDILDSDKYLKGKAAEGVRTYLNYVHRAIIQSILGICFTHQGLYSKYYLEYTSKIDTGMPFHIPSDEVEEIKKAINDEKKKQQKIDAELTRVVDRISDIFSVKRQDYTQAGEAHKLITDHADKLINNVQALENSHYSKDFVDTEKSIAKTKAFINDCLSTTRNFKSEFTVSSLNSIGSAVAFYGSVNEMSENIQHNEKEYAKAIDNASEQVKMYDDAEKAKREKIVKVAKFVVGTVGVVASVAAIVCSGGTAAPLVLGSVMAITKATEKAVDLAGNEYIEKGNLKDMDWQSFGVNVAAAGAIGFITGCATGALGEWTSGLNWAKNAANSSSIVTRCLGKAGTGAIENIADKAVERGIESTAGVITSKKYVKDPVGKIIGSVINPKEIVKDAVTGGVKGTVGEIFDSGAKKLHLDSKWLNNDDTAKRGAGAFAYKGGQKTAQGVSTRFTEKIIDKGDVSEAVKDAFDIKKIGNDFVKGGAKGAAEYTAGHKAVGDKVTAKDLKNKETLNQVTINAVPRPKSFEERGGTIYRDSLGKVTYQSKDKKDILVVDSNKNPIYERSTIDETQVQWGGGFKSSTKR